MNIKKKSFVIIGLIIGLIYGLLPAIYAYKQAPSIPGPYELGVQVLVVGFFGIVGAALGLFTGMIINFVRKNNNF